MTRSIINKVPDYEPDATIEYHEELPDDVEMELAYFWANPEARGE